MGGDVGGFAISGDIGLVVVAFLVFGTLFSVIVVLQRSRVKVLDTGERLQADVDAGLQLLDRRTAALAAALAAARHAPALGSSASASANPVGELPDGTPAGPARREGVAEQAPEPAAEAPAAAPITTATITSTASQELATALAPAAAPAPTRAADGAVPGLTVPAAVPPGGPEVASTVPAAADAADVPGAAVTTTGSSANATSEPVAVTKPAPPSGDAPSTPGAVAPTAPAPPLVALEADSGQSAPGESGHLADAVPGPAQTLDLTLDPAEAEPLAATALSDARGRLEAARTLRAESTAITVSRACRRMLLEGLHAVAEGDRLLGRDPGPALPPPTDADLVETPVRVAVGGQEHIALPAYAPGYPYCYSGGVFDIAEVPGGWYAEPFWEDLLRAGVGAQQD